MRGGWRPSIRAVLIAGILGIQIVTVGAILAWSYFSSQEVQLGHARQLMGRAATEARQQAETFLAAAQGTAELTRRLASHEILRTDDFPGMERYFFEQLRLHPRFAGIYFGSLDGSFAFVKRDQTRSEGGFFTKTIRHSALGRDVELTWRDADYRLVKRSRDRFDLFDPRERPWYAKAMARQGHVWTDPYVFFTSNNPGISAAHPVSGRGGRTIGVVGVDIEIVDLSRHLASLRVSDNALAFILNANGDVIAFPSLEKIRKERTDGTAGLRLARIDEVEDAVARAAFQATGLPVGEIALEESALVDFGLAGDRYMASFQPILGPFLPWTLGIVVPESDFLGALKDNQRTTILIACLVTLVACLAGFLLWRSIARPLADLRGYTRRVREGDFSAPASLETPYAELSDTMTSFQLMVAGLRERDRRNQELAESLRESETKLHQAQKMEAMGQLTGGIAHDFNNLLGIIVGNLDLLREKLGSEEERRHVDSAVAAALRGSHLTQRLLAFARRQTLKPELVDLNALVAGMVTLLERSLGQAIAIESRPDPQLRPVRVDPAQMEAALLNLATNARLAMPEGGRLTIVSGNMEVDEARAREEPELAPGPYVCVSVSDNGSGMAPEVLARVFEPFFTTRGPGEGSGLGLSMVYGFMQQSRGRVELTSEEGRGTTVRLIFPAATEESDAPPQRGGDGSEPSGGGETILVVEDDPDMRALARSIVAGLGYQVLAAPDGPAALALLEEEGRRVDLLFTDLVLPRGMDGAALAAEARRRRPDLRVLFTSGYNRPAAESGAGLEGDMDLIGKPYRRDELARRLRAALDRRAA